jgi:serine/threonine protein kinase
LFPRDEQPGHPMIRKRDNNESSSDPIQGLIDHARAQTEQTRAFLEHPEMLPQPDTFPGYTVLRQIHRGGQGVVYEATQNRGRRRVALKVLRYGPLTGPVEQARFQREVEVLAQFQHPHIVRLYEGGAVDGKLYYAMDFVEGFPFDDYIRNAGCSVPDTVRLVSKIAGAVHAAHLKGIVHRDLKPGNIRVDGNGEPRLLDFGLAKFTGENQSAGLTETITATGQFMGSLPWATPEQVDGSSGGTDIRTDVYALGVLLFHALTQRFPYEVSGTMRTVADNIVHSHPPRPSTIQSGLDDDIDTIVLKCLSKEPIRRYQSAGELAADLERFLIGDPIEAKRDSTWYVFKRMVRRHRTAAVALAMVAAMTLVYAVTMTIVFSKKLAAEQRALQAQQAANFGKFLSALLTEVGSWPNSREAKLVDTYISSVKTAPDNEASLRLQIGKAFRSFGLFDLAEQQTRAALALRIQESGPRDPVTLETTTALALLLSQAEKLDEAERLLSEVLATCKQLLPADHPNIVWKQMYLADVLEKKRQLEEADALYREAIASFTRNPGDGYANYYHAANNYLVFLTNQDRITDAEPLARNAVQLLTEHMGVDDQRVSHMRSNLGRVLFRLGRPLEAEPIHRLLLDEHRAMHGDKFHGSLVMHMVNLAVTLHVLHQFDEAEALLREALAIRERERGSDERWTIMIKTNLAQLLLDRGNLDEAETLARDLRQATERVFGRSTPEWVQASLSLGLVMARSGDTGESQTLIAQSINDVESGIGKADSDYVQALARLARIEAERGASDLAEISFRKAFQTAQHALPPEHWLVGVAASEIGECLFRGGEFDEAEPELVFATDLLCRRLGVQHPESQAALELLADLYANTQRPAEEQQVRSRLIP